MRLLLEDFIDDIDVYTDVQQSDVNVRRIQPLTAHEWYEMIAADGCQYVVCLAVEIPNSTHEVLTYRKRAEHIMDSLGLIYSDVQVLTPLGDMQNGDFVDDLQEFKDLNCEYYEEDTVVKYQLKIGWRVILKWGVKTLDFKQLIKIVALFPINSDKLLTVSIYKQFSPNYVDAMKKYEKQYFDDKNPIDYYRELAHLVACAKLGRRPRDWKYVHSTILDISHFVYSLHFFDKDGVTENEIKRWMERWLMPILKCKPQK